jgi:hypothetical protein
MGLSYASTEITTKPGVRTSGAHESTGGVELGTRSSRSIQSNLHPAYLAGENYPVAFVASFGAGF